MKKIALIVSALLLSVLMNAQTGPAGLHVNDNAPDFSAKDQDGRIISLKEQLKKGPVVLVFYRGQWCPYCNRQLKKLEDSLSFIAGKGAYLIAVTPEISENISKTIEKTNASYPILFDDSLRIMKKYDVAFAVDQQTIDQYKSYGIDFIQANGESNGNNLPVPAIYVINKEGKIVFRHFDKDFTKRASVSEILEHL